MAMQFKLQQAEKLSQQMVITPQLQQAIKLLQNPKEMAEELQQELLENPMLEESHEQDDFISNNVSMEDFISAG